MRKNLGNQELSELDEDLRRAVGDEFSAELAQIESDTHQLRRRGLTVEEFAAELIRRGDRVSVWWGDSRWTGEATFSGQDFIAFHTPELEVTVRTDQVGLMIERGKSGGVSPLGGSRTLVARLAEFELTGEIIRVWARGMPGAVTVRVEVVATDHLVCRDQENREVFLPLSAVLMIARPLPESQEA